MTLRVQLVRRFAVAAIGDEWAERWTPAPMIPGRVSRLRLRVKQQPLELGSDLHGLVTVH